MNRLVIACALAALAACNNSSSDKPAPTATAPTPTPSAVVSAAPSVTASAAPVDAALPPAELKITANPATMAFDVTRFYVTTGQQVHVTLENKGQGTLPHNWVLVKPGKEASYAALVVDKVKDGYYADSPDVLAHTDLVKPGEKTEMTFTAPTTAGNYPYICTFPGHYLMMKGVLVVKEP